MEVPFRTNFDDQRVRYRFCFTCEACANFDPLREVCVHGYPSDLHRLAHYDAPLRPLTIVFCKEFDLA